MAKQELYGFLGLPFSQPTPPGWCEFYDAGEEFFRQLTAEEFRIVSDKGIPRGVWSKPEGARNEALDTRNLARVAAAYKQVDRYEDAEWETVEHNIEVLAPPKPKSAPANTADTIESKPPAPKSEYWGGGDGDSYW